MDSLRPKPNAYAARSASYPMPYVREIADDLRDALAAYVVDGGAVVAPASTWAITARAPQ